MFIKPVELPSSFNQASVWTEHASNSHFVLQTKTSGGALGVLSSLVYGQQRTPRRRSVVDFKCRIVLRLASAHALYVVAVADSLRDIHEDWAWIEQQLFRRIFALDAAHNDPADIDCFLLNEFQAITHDFDDSPGLPGLNAQKIEEVNEAFKKLFKMDDEVVLNSYRANVWKKGATELVKGLIYLTKNYVCWNNESAVSGDDDDYNRLCIPFKDIVSIELLGSKRLFTPDCISITSKTNTTIFAIPSQRSELFDALNHLSNIAVQRLVKANNEIEPARAMSADLSNAKNTIREGYKLRSADEMEAHPDTEKGSSDMRIARKQVPTLRESSESTTASVAKTTEDLEGEKRNIYFRTILRLPLSETLLEAHPCVFWNKSTNTTSPGRLYISQNFVSFVSSKDTSGNTNNNKSMAALGYGNPSLTIVIPLAEITSLNFPAPSLFSIILPTLPSFISPAPLSSYLTVTTRSNREFWFGGFENRTGVRDILLGGMRSVPVTSWETGDLEPTQEFSALSLSSATELGETESTPVSNKLEIITVPLNMLFQKPSPEPRKSSVDSRRVLSGDWTEVTKQPTLAESYKVPHGDHFKEERWVDYFATHGRDTCMIKDEALKVLVIEGIPVAFRGDMWMILSGAWYGTYGKGYYQRLCTDVAQAVATGNKIPVLDEIEKDLHRSLPEHPAYQNPVGIDALRRVLTAYAWRNPKIGYAQAMNIITSVFLLYLNENNAFLLLSTVCERILPENYSKTLVGTVIDQKVFESLVAEYLPDIHRKFQGIGLELSLMSVPWFVCLYINTLPFNVACRAMDCFFYEGPTFLFKLALAIFKENHTDIMTARTEDVILPILRNYFRSLADETPFVPNIQNMTRNRGSYSTVGDQMCSVLFTTAFHSFPGMTMEKLETLRIKHRLQVVHSIEDNHRRSTVRTLSDLTDLSVEEIEIVYDVFKRVVIFGDPEVPPPMESNDDEQEPTTSRDNVSVATVNMFRKIMTELNAWPRAILNSVPVNLPPPDSPMQLSSRTKNCRVSVAVLTGENYAPLYLDSIHGQGEVSPFDRIYTYCERSSRSSGDSKPFAGVDLPMTAKVMDTMYKQNSNAKIRFFFNIHDENGDGILCREELLGVVDTLLWLFVGDQVIIDLGSGRTLPSTISRMKRRRKIAQEAKEQMYIRAIIALVQRASKSETLNDDTLDDEKSVYYRTKRLSSVPSISNKVVTASAPPISSTSLTSLETVKVMSESSPSPPSATLPPGLSNLPPLYTKLVHAIQNIPDIVKINVNEFLVLVLSEPLLVEFFERRKRITAINL